MYKIEEDDIDDRHEKERKKTSWRNSSVRTSTSNLVPSVAVCVTVSRYFVRIFLQPWQRSQTGGLNARSEKERYEIMLVNKYILNDWPFLWGQDKKSNNASRSGWSRRQCQTSTVFKPHPFLLWLQLQGTRCRVNCSRGPGRQVARYRAPSICALWGAGATQRTVDTGLALNGRQPDSHT